MNQMFMIRKYSLHTYIEWTEKLDGKRYELCFWPHDLGVAIFFTTDVDRRDCYDSPLNWTFA